MKIGATNPITVLQNKFSNKDKTPPKKMDGVFVVSNQNKHPAVANKAHHFQIFRENLEAAKEAADAQAEEFRKMRIAFEIAARIMRGDNVPQKDLDFLLKQSPGLFKMAMTARPTDNEDGKDHTEALSKNEEGENKMVMPPSVQPTPQTTTACV
ncbi:MAG: hypothetical protein FWE33_05085 [Defluviitaleaceae bacterium]|nr:hypothetical protein [Defluviitaleaceae bacterium]